MNERFDPYAVLQVSYTADADVIRAAYRALARVYHPDHSPSADAATTMARINKAWEILGDPEARAAHDRSTPPRPATSTDSAGPATPSSTSSSASHAARPNDRPVWRTGPDGEGAAGPPPGRPSGSILTFGRHIGWSLGEIARTDPGYLLWLIGTRAGARYRDEVHQFLPRATGSEPAKSSGGRSHRTLSGIFGR